MRTFSLLLAIALITIGCGSVTFTEIKTCDDLAPQIIELTEEQEGPFSRAVLKLYDIEEVNPTGYVLECKANAKWNKGEEGTIKFYLEEDNDGDQFIGYEAEDSPFGS